MVTLFNAQPSSFAPAIRFGAATLTYGELDELAFGYAEMLHRHAVVGGDRVAVWTAPCVETIVALYANAKFGVTSVPVNANIGARELRHIFDDALPKLLVVPESATLPFPFEHAPVLRTGLTRADATSLQPSYDAPLLILYTSGTTGAPKGAVLTYANAATNLDALADAWEWTREDTVVHALPLFHVHGLVLGLFGPLRRGGTLHFLPRFDEEALARALGGKSTMLFAVPTMYHRLIGATEKSPTVRDGLRAARMLISGSAAMPVRDHNRLYELTGRRVLERYGLTETLINCSVRASDPPRPGRVGRPLPGIELRLVDDARNALDVRDDSTIGEIAVRGANVFAGYLNRDDATASVMDDAGFFYTGDLATVDTSGSIRIVGRRATDLIKTGGYKVGAGEVEAAILEHPLVSECAVLGIADDDLGERIVAYVVLHSEGSALTESALVEHTTSMISAHKRPRRVHFVDALPRNAMGKVVKSELRKHGAPR
ncbi:MAG: AMP-binding protein [Sandaracinaceae bacterium]|nr:AMP-binding protein [Sandaracinaceae bacterium]